MTIPQSYMPTREELNEFALSLTAEEKDDLKLRFEFMTAKEIHDGAHEAHRQNDRRRFLKLYAVFMTKVKYETDLAVLQVLQRLFGEGK